jgi:glutathione peroxidase
MAKSFYTQCLVTAAGLLMCATLLSACQEQISHDGSRLAPVENAAHSPRSTQGIDFVTSSNQAPSPSPSPATLVFDGLTGGQINLADYSGKVVLVVNTASKCGFTGQYKGLEALYKARQNDGLVIIGVPSNEFGGQEPGSADEIASFCELNYGVTFPMAAKTKVKGADAHPFYKNAVATLGPSAQPAWNFHKVLVGKDGRPIAAFASGVTPDAQELTRAIDAALAS